jgi:hypothetical protein
VGTGEFDFRAGASESCEGGGELNVRIDCKVEVGDFQFGRAIFMNDGTRCISLISIPWIGASYIDLPLSLLSISSKYSSTT